jgi:hypothetical protein
METCFRDPFEREKQQNARTFDKAHMYFETATKKKTSNIRPIDAFNRVKKKCLKQQNI